MGKMGNLSLGGEHFVLEGAGQSSRCVGSNREQLTVTDAIRASASADKNDRGE
jgi:hypothetical protein